MILKAITVREPWASAILLGKDVENRSRYFSHRGPLLIHAATKVDVLAFEDPRILALPPIELNLGKLIGIVTVVDCVRTSDSPWADDKGWKLVLTNPRPLRLPVAWRGQLSLFEVDSEALRDVLPEGFEQENHPGHLPFS